ncbi:MAG: hypothetical protein ACLGIJ_12120 [Candidatus Limnocylindria bacterium]
MIRSSFRGGTAARAVVASLLAVLALTAVPVGAHAPDPTMGGALFAQDQDLRFRWRAGSVPPAAIAAAIQAAAADASRTRASRAPTFALDAGGASQIGYGAGAPCGPNGIGCFDRSGAPVSFTMWLREHGRVFDWGVLRWCQQLAQPANGCFDAETIALDEFGHVAILAHHVNFADERDYEDAVVQAVSRTRPNDGWDMHTYGRCDVATLQRTYDVATTHVLISTCLDLDTNLTLRTSATSTTYGKTVTMTATLTIVDRAAYDRLGGNLLSRRVVRLQRRLAGSTTWTTIATMTPASSAGTYATSTAITTTADYRAVFSTPSGEGLRGDTSATVRVTMSGCGTTACPQRGSGPTPTGGRR